MNFLKNHFKGLEKHVGKIKKKHKILCYLFQNVLPLKLSSFNRDRLNPVYLEDLNASRRIQVKKLKAAARNVDKDRQMFIQYFKKW